MNQLKTVGSFLVYFLGTTILYWGFTQLLFEFEPSTTMYEKVVIYSICVGLPALVLAVCLTRMTPMFNHQKQGRRSDDE